MGDLAVIMKHLGQSLWSGPFLMFVAIASIVITIGMNFAQFRYFFASWKMLLFPPKSEKNADMTPLQAFINALGTSVGNGSLAGIPSAIYAGGPGAAIWLFIFSAAAMGLRFAEVYLSTCFTGQKFKTATGGPMLYLSKVPGGSVLPYIYAFFCLCFGLINGNAMQANSISLGIKSLLPVSIVALPAFSWVLALALFSFTLYVMFGGAHRIVKVADTIVPLKVAGFFVTAIIVLLYHWQAIIPAISLMVKAAFTPNALVGGMLGFSLQRMMSIGISRSLTATEAGVGSAGLFFGATGSKEPVKDGLLAMLSAFISSYFVCFAIAVMVVASGMWNSGLQSTELTIATYQTVFGSMGGLIVTLLSISFGIGVLVPYAYACRACWLFLTGNRLSWLFTGVYCLITLFGSLAQVDVIWLSGDIVNAVLLAINLFGILMLLPVIRKGIKAYKG